MPPKKNGTTESRDGSPEVFSPSKGLHTDLVSMDRNYDSDEDSDADGSFTKRFKAARDGHAHEPWGSSARSSIAFFTLYELTLLMRLSLQVPVM